MKLTRTIYFVTALISMVCLAGCMVGPDYERPQTAADGANGFVHAPQDWADSNDIKTPSWWKRFGDPVIDGLVAEALENNTDLKIAAWRVLESEALLKQSHGIRLPDISYSADRTRSKSSFTLAETRLSFISQNYSQSLSVSYIVDFFGKLKRSERAAMSDLLSTRAGQKALIHSVIARVVASRVQIASLQRQLDIARQNTATWQQTQAIVRRRYNAGLVSSLDVYRTGENLAAAQAAEPALERSLAIAAHGLDVLLGRRPGTSAKLARTLPDLPGMEPVPIALPAALLDQRPDVIEAELRLAAGTERIGVSIAEMYPDLTLSAAGGYSANRFKMLTEPQSQIWSSLILLAAPVFKGGRLKAGVAAAEARAAQARAAYAGVVLKALAEVEDALVSEKMLRQRLERLQRRLQQARKSESLGRQRYMDGLERLLVILDTQRRRQIAEVELVHIKNELFNNRINLFLAIGGDWQIDPKQKQVGLN